MIVKYVKFIVLIICSLLIENTLYDSYHGDNLFLLFIYSGLGAIWIYCFFRIVQDDIGKFRIKRKLLSLWKSVVSILALAPLFIIYFYYQPKLNKPTLFFANRHGVYADFKTDGTYFIKSGPWASKKYFYGTYLLKDSIVELDRAPLGEELITKSLMIKNTLGREETEFPVIFRMQTPTHLVQLNEYGIIQREGVDEKGNKVMVPIRFEISVDNRKMVAGN